MIGDGRGLDSAGFQAQPAQWLLTKLQLEILYVLAQHLAPPDRGPFVAAVTRRLAAEHREHVGARTVWRIAIEEQRRFLSPPAVNRAKP